MITISEPWSLTLAWESIIRRIMADGYETSPRGMKTKELMHVDVHFDCPNEYVFYNDVRNVNPVMHVVELMYFLNGREDDVLATTWLKGMENYLNPETRLFDGGYGPSIARGLPHVFHELQRDKDTRRAVIPILRPDHVVRMSHTNDYPCNPLMGFNLRGGDLNMWVVTRSQDMMQGYIYDQLEFRLLQLMMSRALQVEVGAFDHHIVSCHLYERDFEKAVASLGKAVPVAVVPVIPIASVPDFWRYVRRFNALVDFPSEASLAGTEDAGLAVYRYFNRARSGECPGVFSAWVERWLEMKAAGKAKPTQGNKSCAHGASGL